MALVGRAGWALAAGLTPVVLAGVVLTASVFGAIMGVPILLLAGRPWWLAVGVARGRRDPADLTPAARVHVGVCVAALVVALLAALAVGLDDLDSAVDLAGLAAGTAGVGLAVVGGVGLLAPARARVDR